MSDAVQELVQKMKKGDRRAFSRLLSYVEDRDEKTFEVLAQLWADTGSAVKIGVTGPAGAGKSTLMDQLVSLLRKKGKKVGVIAVDPTSPFSGGAVLGDRVRMQRHSTDPDVFIRSVGSRGRSGGVSFSTRALIHLFDAFGMDTVLIETVGAGQSEVDIVDLVDTTVVVLVPEAGDSIQALKAGLLEIADVFVVNKKDRDGADQIKFELETSIAMDTDKEKWHPSVLLTEAVSGEGVSELWTEIERHQAELKTRGLSSKERLRRNLHGLLEIMEARFSIEILSRIQSDPDVTKDMEKNGNLNLYTLAERLMERYRSDSSE